MDGRYLSNSYPFTAKHKALINKWIQSAIANKLWEDGIDIHVDEICKDGRYKQYWIPLSISLVYYANRFLQEINRADIIGVVVIQLKRHKMGSVNFDRLENIRVAFNLPPPSLYLISEDCKEIVDKYQNYAKKLRNIFIDDSQFDILTYGKPWTEDSINYIRQISLVPADHKIKLSTSFTPKILALYGFHGIPT